MARNNTKSFGNYQLAASRPDPIDRKLLQWLLSDIHLNGYLKSTKHGGRARCTMQLRNHESCKKLYWTWTWAVVLKTKKMKGAPLMDSSFISLPTDRRSRLPAAVWNVTWHCKLFLQQSSYYITNFPFPGLLSSKKAKRLSSSWGNAASTHC